MASSSVDDKKIVFSGTYYEAWRAHIISGISAQENTYETIAETISPLEAEFMELDPMNYQARHRRYLRRQEAAKSFIFNRLTLPIINTIRRCQTVCQILRKLDDEYRTQSTAAEASARRNFYGLHFDDGGDLKKYLLKFENYADRLLDSGHFISETEKTSQLISSLTKDYDIAITNYHIYRREFGQSYETLKRMLIDRFERNFDEKQLEARYSHPRRWEADNTRRSDNEYDRSSPTPRRFTGTRNPRYPPRSGISETDTERNRNRYDFQQPTTCHQCHGFGHKQSDCPSKLKTKDENTKQREEIPTTSSYDEKKTKAHAMMVSPGQPLIHKTPLKPEPADPVFLLDTGAFKHMSSKINMMNRVSKLPEPQQLQCASRNAPLEATHAGEMLLEVRNRFGETSLIFLEEVLFVPLLDVDLLSENKITESGRYEIRITQNFADIIEVQSGEITFSAKCEGDAKYVYYQPIVDKHDRQHPTVSPVSATVPPANPITTETEQQPEKNSTDQKNAEKWKWHRRMGHISGKYLRILCQNNESMPKNLNISDNDFSECEVCIMAKSTHLGHKSMRRKAERRFDILSTDMMGPFTPGPNGEKFVATFVDNYSNFVSIALLKKKSDIADAFAKFHKQTESKFPNQLLHLLRSDCAREYLEGDFRRYCDAAGVTIEDSSPYAPQLNGVAERMNRTLTERMRAILFAAKLEPNYWPNAMVVAAYLVNRSLSRTNQNSASPFEIWHGRQTNLSQLRVFGCLAHRFIPEPVRNTQVGQRRRQGEPADTKICPRSEPRILVGFTTTGYTVIDPVTKKLTNSCDVRFNENKNKETMHEPVIPVIADNDDAETKTATPSPIHATTTTSALLDIAIPENIPNNHEHFTNHTPPESCSNTHLPLQDHTYAAYSLFQQQTRRPRKLLEECVPKSYKDIAGNPYEREWLAAAQMELKAMADNKVFEIVDRTKNLHPLDSKWVFTVKYTDLGEPYAKGRLVARGFRDKTDYEIADTYSPVVNQWLIRWAISIANHFHLHLTKYDVSTAFLNADIHSPMHLQIPEGMSENKNDKVISLKRSIYGLKTSSKSWYTTLDDTIIQLGFTQSKADRCLYYQKMPNQSIALLLVYVDDMMLLTDSTQLIQSTTQALQEKFKITHQPEPSFFVGFEICRNAGENIITLKQTKYIERLLKRFELDQSHPQTTPMESGLKLTRPAMGKDDTEYRAMIGALLYVARGTRPDIAFAVNTLSRFQTCSTDNEKKLRAQNL